MLMKLVNYELTKKWKSSRYVLFGFVVLEAVLLFISRTFFWNEKIKIFANNQGNTHQYGISIALTILLYFVLAACLGAYPFIESLYRYKEDLSGKQAVLELMIPVTSWKKIISKLIATLCTTIVCAVLSAFSIIIFAMMMGGNYNKEAVDFILNMVRFPVKSILVFLHSVFSFASLYMIFFFCIAFSQSFSHKNKIAVPIGIGAFIICIALLTVLGIQADRFPIVRYSIFGIDNFLSTTLIDIIVFVTTLLAASWIMEKRIEH